MATLTKEQILCSLDLPRVEVDVPEWGGSVFVRTMTGSERDAFEVAALEARSNGSKSLLNIRAKLAAQTLVDADGNRLFTDKDAEALGGKSAKALSRVWDSILDLNGLRAEDVAEFEGKA